MEDYSISKIDYKIPSIEIEDAKTRTTYTATFTDTVELLNYHMGPEIFNDVISTNAVRKEESVYSIKDNSLIIIQMTFTIEEYEIVLEREMPNSISLFSTRWNRFQTLYQKNVTVKNKLIKQPLLTRIYDNQFTYSDTEGTFEHIYTYSPTYRNFIEKNDSQDKYFIEKMELPME